LKYYSIHEFSKLIGRTPQTLRNWDNSGKLKPNHTGASGYRYYSHEQFREVLQIKDDSKDKKALKQMMDTVTLKKSNSTPVISSLECDDNAVYSIDLQEPHIDFYLKQFPIFST
jgi:DNA-binding transcriptional MerR regulator